MSKKNKKSKGKKFKNFFKNKRKFRKKYSLLRKKASDKSRKIDFQLIGQAKVEINPSFFMPNQIVSLIKKNNGYYDKETKTYQISVSNYNNLYKDLKNISNKEEYKTIVELQNIFLEPIPSLPYEIASKSKNIQIIKFKSTTNHNKKSSTNIDLDYTKDEKKSINSLSNDFLSLLYKFQKEGINFGIEKKGRILLADEMGVGKTIQAIGISLLYKENWPVLIICPASLKFVWRNEILRWIPDINADKDIQIVKSGKDEFLCDEKFYIISYDLTIKFEQKLIDKQFNFIIADEAHYLKSLDAKRTKCLLPIIQKSKRILLLTGTPILSKPLELYPLLTMLRPDIFNNFKVFGNRYCDPKQKFVNNNWFIDWSGCSNAKELNYILKNIMIRRLKKDVINQLPPKKRQKIEIETDPKIIKKIKSLNVKNEIIYKELDNFNNNLNIENLKEIRNENNMFNKIYMLTAEAKVKGVKEYIHYLIENKCKFLIFGHHRIMLDSIEEEVKKLKVDYIRIDGEVKPEARQEYVNKFQSNEDCLIAILSITACYSGITLTAASTVIFSELYMTPAIMIQAEDRAHRIGQEHECVNIHYLYGPDTLDDILFKMLNKKQNIFSNTLDNMSKNMEVKNSSKKVGDFEKGKNYLDLNINNSSMTKIDNEVNNNSSIQNKSEENNNIINNTDYINIIDYKLDEDIQKIFKRDFMDKRNRDDSSPSKLMDNEEKNKKNINNNSDSKNNVIDNQNENDTSIINIDENLKKELIDDNNFK